MTKEFSCDHGKEYAGHACAACLAMAYQRGERLKTQLEQAEIDRVCAIEGTEWLRVKMEEMKLQNQELMKLLRRAEDSLGPDRTATDRKTTLMEIGKHLIEKKKCLCGCHKMDAQLGQVACGCCHYPT